MRLPAKSRLHRILRRLPLRTRVFQRENTTVRVPARGVWPFLKVAARDRTRPQEVASPSASYALQASCLSLPREPHAGSHECKPVELAAKKAAEISAIERQKNIGRCQRAEQNRSVLLHRKNGGLVDRHDIIDDNELAPKAQPLCGDRCRESHEIANCLRHGIGCRHQ